MLISKNDLVQHASLGLGTVVFSEDKTAVVRFAHGIEECILEVLTVVTSIFSRLQDEDWDIPLEVINRLQAEAVLSTNRTWGVFTGSRIEILPHQLWVCRKVTRTWPFRWLVADDVGLGKTIEAGVILMSLFSSQRLRRVLILTPASIVEQWHYRLRTMFDIRFSIYTPEADSPKMGFWQTHNLVLASLQTMRLDRGKRQDRLLESEPWDLLIVDEAHHLNADERQGATLGYELAKKLQDHNKVSSILFFTGTPHRGKTFGFLSLLHLLHPDIFDPKRSFSSQSAALRECVIRNNKYNVTDLEGRPLFQKHKVIRETYTYSDQEADFYSMLSDFIVRGKAYASNLSTREGSSVMLVLIAMQKLASSSIAAIRNAIRGRLDRISSLEEKNTVGDSSLKLYGELEDDDEQDRMALLEESIPVSSRKVRLGDDEVKALKELLNEADKIETETKISRIIEMVTENFPQRSVLFFTEYKATQALLMSALMARFGEKSVTFINGDNAVENMRFPDGRLGSIRKGRESVVDDFNSGKVQFLVSTEAAGEGIDLQENCHTMFHVDLPWNPMRLHQRVGRLNRYGQKQRVEVVTLFNPETVEARIYDVLQAKIGNICEAFNEVMTDPEDLYDLVLGTTPPSVFRDVFGSAGEVPREAFSDWFDSQTSRFGGEDAVDVVRSLTKNVCKFDFGQVSSLLPRVELQDLAPFFEASLILNGRKLSREEDLMSFKTPEAWLDLFGMRPSYENMTFTRSQFRGAKQKVNLLGVGHRLMDTALTQAVRRNAFLASLPSNMLQDMIIVFRIQDRVTDGPEKPPVVVGVEMTETEGKILQDWQLLKVLNDLPIRKEVMRDVSRRILAVNDRKIQKAYSVLQGALTSLGLDFRVPWYDLIGLLVPRTKN